MDDLVPDGTIDPTGEFDDAVQKSLNLLQREIDFGLWMCSRLIGDDWVILHVADRNGGVQPRQCMSWRESVCSRMAAELGPQFASSIEAAPAFVSAPILRQFHIGAYIGVELRRKSGAPFGTLCAVDPVKREVPTQRQNSLVMYVARFISSLVEREFEIAEHYREIEFDGLAKHRHAATGLLDHDGWQLALQMEDRARAVLATASSLACIRMLGMPNDDHATDAIIAEARQQLELTSPATLPATRSDREYVIALLPEHDQTGAQNRITRVADALRKNGQPCIVAARSARFDTPLAQLMPAVRNAVQSDEGG